MDSSQSSVGRAQVTALQHVERSVASSESASTSDMATRTAMVEALGLSPEKLSPKDVSWLYRAVVAGLIATMVIALMALAWTILDGNDRTSPDLLLTVFTGALGGLVGLFARSPN